jgi:hypothetical protein
MEFIKLIPGPIFVGAACQADQMTWNQFFNFQNIVAKNLEKLLALLTRTTVYYTEKVMITIPFIMSPIFSPKLMKNPKNGMNLLFCQNIFAEKCRF